MRYLNIHKIKIFNVIDLILTILGSLFSRLSRKFWFSNEYFDSNFTADATIKYLVNLKTGNRNF